MKIGIVGYEANVKSRVGSNQYAFEILHSLYQIDNQNNYIIYLPTTPLADFPKERENWCYKVGGPVRLWNFFGLPKLILGSKPDVVFNPGHYIPPLKMTPLVISIMDVGFLHFPEQFTRSTLLKLKWWTRRSLRISDAVLAISQVTKEDVMKNYHLPDSKITVTHPGYDKNKFRFPYPEIRMREVKKKYSLDKDYLLFLGTLKPSKNILGLIKAFAIVSDKMKDLDLVISGRKGWLYETIFDEAKKAKLEDRIIFTDFVPDEDLGALVAGAKAFVLPSFWEGFGIPVIEAMGSGVPVVVAKTGSLPEVVAKAGIVVNPCQPESIAEGIFEALGNHQKWQDLGLARAAAFSWGECGRQTLAVLEKFAKKG